MLSVVAARTSGGETSTRIAGGQQPLKSSCINDASVTTGVVTSDSQGAARRVLAPNVVQLDPEQAVLEAMLQGWGRQQRARFLKDATIAPRLRLVRRLGLDPVCWTR